MGIPKIHLPLLVLILGLLGGSLFAALGRSRPPAVRAAGTLPPIVFIARSHLATKDTIFQNEVGPAGQFGTGIPKFAPGSQLVRRDPGGALFVYSTPGLVDVQSPDVSLDGSRIVFAGATTLIPGTTDSGWRLYEINVDGTGFKQLTFSDRSITIPNATDFKNQETYGSYSDLFPAYLADGRIVFASSRYPTRAHYDQRAAFNLYVINSDGTGLHRISTERGGLIHPAPLPDGRILASRWWNQFNQPSELEIYNRIDNADVDQFMPDGTIILANPDAPFNPALGVLPGGYGIRDAPNTWHLMVLNPDGTDFRRLAWTPRFRWSLTDDSGHYDTYAAAQPAPVFVNGDLYIAYTAQTDSSMVHSTLETGVRVALPTVDLMYANTTDAIAGLTYDQAWGQGDDSGPYALHPWGLPDGSILFSQSVEDDTLPTSGTYTEGANVFNLQGSNLQYLLHTMSIDGTGLAIVPVDLVSIGMPDADVMDAKPVVVRTGWSSMPDSFTDVASDDPVLGNLPNTMPEYAFSQHGPGEILTATIHNPNVYANPPLDLPFVNNSPPPGSVARAQVWVDANQFTGAKCYNGWPQPCDDFRQDNTVRAVLWDDVPVTLGGAFTMTVPADTMGFVVLRDASGRVVRSWNRGYISIAQGSAWARPGEMVTCTGCHMGHVSGSLDAVQADSEAGWTNVAPYGEATSSSFYAYTDPDNPSYQPFRPHFLNDRRGWVPLPAGGPPAPELDPALLPDLAQALLLRGFETLGVNPGGIAAFTRASPAPLDLPFAAASIAGGSAGYQDDETGWISALGESSGVWVELSWPLDLLVREIRLVGPPASGGDWSGFGEPSQYGDYYVEAGSLDLFLAGAQVGSSIPVGRVEPLENGGTLIVLSTPTVIDRLRFTVQATSGRWWWDEVAALNEIEVIGRPVESWPALQIFDHHLPIVPH